MYQPTAEEFLFHSTKAHISMKTGKQSSAQNDSVHIYTQCDNVPGLIKTQCFKELIVTEKCFFYVARSVITKDR